MTARGVPTDGSQPGREPGTVPLVLLVEDNPDDVELARRAFARCGLPVEVEVARNGREAIDRLEPCGPDGLPSLVLLDLNLPRIGGIKVLEWVRSNPATRVLPVVVLSTSLHSRDVSECYRAGANSYLCKPVDFREFAGMVRELAGFWLRLNRLPAKDRRGRRDA